MRSGASNQYRIITFLPAGTDVEVIGEENDFSRVRTDRGTEGWVPIQYLVSQPIARDRLPALQREIDQLEGTITALVPDEERDGDAAAQAVADKRVVDVAGIAPWMRGLGRYRADLAERFDLRLAGFTLRLGFWDAETGQRCYAHGAINDPTGEGGFGDCFGCDHPRLGRKQLCRDEPAWPSPVAGDEEVRRMLAGALRGGLK